MKKNVTTPLTFLFPLVLLLPLNAEAKTVAHLVQNNDDCKRDSICAAFFYDVENFGFLTCNGKEEKDQKDQPVECPFESDELEVSLEENWKGFVAKFIYKEDGPYDISGDCRDSIIRHSNYDSFSLHKLCMPGPSGFKFNFDSSNGGGSLKCNGKPAIDFGNNVHVCPDDGLDKLVISRESWGWEGKAIFSKSSDKIEITGFCAGSVKPLNPQGEYPLDAACLSNNKIPPPATGTVLVKDEWFTDLPWHQKLSTLDSNLIDVPFVLPVEALDLIDDQSVYCNDEGTARCMLRYGIANVMAVKRTDTAYREGEALTLDDCKDINGDNETNCVEVKLNIYRFHTNTDKKLNSNGVAYEADPIRNNSYDSIPSLGFAVTEATIFAPWRPWYTSHYCAFTSDSTRDGVCYDDYFTTQLLAGTPIHQNWIKDRPALFWPRGEKGTIFETFCQSIEEGNSENSCTMYLGKVAWDNSRPKPRQSKVIACDIPEPADPLADCQNQVDNDTVNLDVQFNDAIKGFKDQDRFAWDESEINFEQELDKEINFMDTNPFIGFYELERSERNNTDGVFRFKAPHYALPKKCTKEDYWKARTEKNSPTQIEAIERLADCVVNYEIHTSGFHDQWKKLYGGTLNDAAVKEITKVLGGGIKANQYGRTMFMYAGVPEQHVAVSFEMLKTKDKDDIEREMSIYDKVYNGSLYIQFLPVVNPADLSLTNKGEMSGKNYTDNFWHAFFMSNHMNQTPGHFIRGIRGRTLWHNEFRSNLMYQAVTEDENRTIGTKFAGVLEPINFPAGFQAVGVDPNKKEPGQPDLAPFHGNTCDSCHVRNGSGVPLMPNGKLPEIHVEREQGMKSDYTINYDYTFTNKFLSELEGEKRVLPSLKMVFFDLKGGSDRIESCRTDITNPQAGLQDIVTVESEEKYHQNKIMNFYGDSFHVNQKLEGGKLFPTYAMEYVNIETGDGFDIVVERDETTPYQPKRVEIKEIQTGSVCQEIVQKEGENWPENCTDVSGDKILEAIYGNENTEPSIGFMHLMGRRLGNTPMIEMIPDQSIRKAQNDQMNSFGHQGCYSLAPGTRAGAGENDFHYRNCSEKQYGTGKNDCYIGRWGWFGDRASLEDQVANAAHVEMNVTSKESFHIVNPHPKNHNELVRYYETLCGPADATCQNTPSNSDITEQEIRDMATYQRWIGIPNRNEYQVSSQQVQDGEELFRKLQCDSCHVIDKIVFDYNDNMLPDEERDLLKNLQSIDVPDYPFISYLGTDLLLHDMGYLSQVARAPDGKNIRYKKGDEEVENGEAIEGTVREEYKNYVQRIRTPALKGLRFNRFVTDSNHNTEDANGKLKNNFTPGCDFLLHDGRACDAIEAAFLHDGPAIKALGTIEELNKLAKKEKIDEKGNPVKDKNGRIKKEIEDLRAFLYSL